MRRPIEESQEPSKITNAGTISLLERQPYDVCVGAMREGHSQGGRISTPEHIIATPFNKLNFI